MENKISWEDAVQLVRKDSSQAQLVKDCFFDDPLLDAAKRYHKSVEWKAVQKILGSRRGEVLDVGAGRGIASYALAQDGWITVALEPDSSPLVGAGAIRQLSKEASVAIEVVETWGETLPFRDNSFDLVFCRQVLHHAHDLPAFCREISRVLRPGGIMLALREHVISREADLPVFLQSHPLHKYYGGEHAYTLKHYRDVIENAGLKITKTLNPSASEINTFPRSIFEIKCSLADRFYFPFPRLIPDWLMSLKGSFINNPGRIYSFVARK